MRCGDWSVRRGERSVWISAARVDGGVRRESATETEYESATEVLDVTRDRTTLTGDRRVGDSN